MKGEEYKGKKGNVFEFNLQIQAHNGSGFDTRIVLNNLLCDKKIVNIKKRKGISQINEFNGYIEKKKKQVPQYLHFRRGLTHLNYSLKKLGKTF